MRNIPRVRIRLDIWEIRDAAARMANKSIADGMSKVEAIEEAITHISKWALDWSVAQESDLREWMTGAYGLRPPPPTKLSLTRRIIKMTITGLMKKWTPAAITLCIGLFAGFLAGRISGQRYTVHVLQPPGAYRALKIDNATGETMLFNAHGYWTKAPVQPAQ